MSSFCHGVNNIVFIVLIIRTQTFCMKLRELRTSSSLPKLKKNPFYIGQVTFKNYMNTEMKATAYNIFVTLY
jgi:hypothetical protein